MPKKHYKTGEKTAKKNLDQFLTLDLDQFLTLETPNLGPVFNSTAYIYIYIERETWGPKVEWERRQEKYVFWTFCMG